jgi:serine/threonine protein kinase
MDLLLGGDLRYHICRRKTFKYYIRLSESETKFFVANILFGLDYIHQNGILHRDLKPENLVFDDKGIIK